MCKISVIVPVYNVEQYIRRCVDSILNQTYTDFELILIDDGSTDRSGEICDEYALTYSQIQVIHNSNKGVAHSRNCGIDKAKGDYIVFIDSDDYLDSDYFEQLTQTDADLIFSGYTRENSSKHYQYAVNLTPEYFTDMQKLYMSINNKVFGYMCAMCVSKSFLDRNNIRLNENYSFREDTLFAINCLEKASSAYICPSVAYHYVQYGDGRQLTSKVYDRDIFEEQLYITKLLFNFMLTLGINDAEKEISHNCYRHCVYKSIINAVYTGNLNISYIKKVLNNDFVEERRIKFDKLWLENVDTEWKSEMTRYLNKAVYSIYFHHILLRWHTLIIAFFHRLKATIIKKA